MVMWVEVEVSGCVYVNVDVHMDVLHILVSFDFNVRQLCACKHGCTPHPVYPEIELY